MATRAAGGAPGTWRGRTRAAASVLARILLAGVLLLASGGGLLADEGDPSWAGGPLEVAWNEDAGRAVELALVSTGDHLYVATTDRKIYCYELDSGRAVWKRRFKPDLPTAPAAGGGRVFLQVGVAEEGRLLGLDAADGDDLWNRPQSPRAVQLAVVDTTLLVLRLDGVLEGVDPTSGRTRWTREGFGWDAPGLVTDGERIYVLAREDSLLALSPDVGRVEWGAGLPGRFAASPELADGHLLAVTAEGTLYRVEAASGLARAMPASRRPLQLVPPVLCGERIVTVSSDGWVEASAQDGQEAWSLDLTESVRARPIPSGPLLLVPTAGGRLLALRVETGAQVWSLELGERLLTAPLLTAEHLVVATSQGDVYVYRH